MAQLMKIAAQMSNVAMQIAVRAGIPISIQDVVTDPMASKLGCQTWHATSALNSLVKAGKLSKFKSGRQWMYEIPIKKGDHVIKPVKIPEDVVPEGLKIQINKKTKVLTLQYEGLKIEISVVG